MKKILLSIACALAVLVAVPTGTFAAEPEELPGPSMTPTNMFYFMETWMQHMSLRFTSGAEAKLQKAIKYAGEKLSEMEAMSEQNKAGFMKRVANEYRYFVNVANRNMERAMVGDNGTGEQVALMMANHISVMTNNRNNGSEDCQQIRQQTQDSAEACQETAVRTLAGQDPESAVRLNISLMEQQCTRMNNCLGQNDEETIEESLQQYERLQLMNREILACAEQLGKGPQAQEMIESAEAEQNGVLSRIQNQLQIGEAGPKESPVQNQTQEQEQNQYQSSDTEEPGQNSEQNQSGNPSNAAGENGSGGTSKGGSGSNN